MNAKVTDRIKQDLVNQLTSGSALPFKLTLAGIASYYEVSLTPVRLVVDTLIGQQLLVRKSNGRLLQTNSLVKKALQTDAIIGEKPINLNSGLDEILTEYIVKLSLINHSDYLREEATAKKYDVGRTMIRQVFSRLEGAGFLEHVPRCGWKVRNIREKEMTDYLEIREILEVKALKLAKPLLVKSELEQILEENIVNQNPRLAEVNNDLHDYWISRSENWYIQDFFNRHGAFYTALFNYASLNKSLVSDMAQEHRDILENLIDENWAAAEKALIKHIREQKLHVLKWLEENHGLRMNITI